MKEIINHKKYTVKYTVRTAFSENVREESFSSIKKAMGLAKLYKYNSPYHDVTLINNVTNKAIEIEPYKYTLMQIRDGEDGEERKESSSDDYTFMYHLAQLELCNTLNNTVMLIDNSTKKGIEIEPLTEEEKIEAGIYCVPITMPDEMAEITPEF